MSRATVRGARVGGVRRPARRASVTAVLLVGVLPLAGVVVASEAGSASTLTVDAATIQGWHVAAVPTGAAPGADRRAEGPRAPEPGVSRPGDPARDAQAANDPGPGRQGATPPGSPPVTEPSGPTPVPSAVAEPSGPAPAAAAAPPADVPTAARPSQPATDPDGSGEPATGTPPAPDATGEPTAESR